MLCSVLGSGMEQARWDLANLSLLQFFPTKAKESFAIVMHIFMYVTLKFCTLENHSMVSQYCSNESRSPECSLTVSGLPLQVHFYLTPHFFVLFIIAPVLASFSGTVLGFFLLPLLLLSELSCSCPFAFDSLFVFLQ